MGGAGQVAVESKMNTTSVKKKIALLIPSLHVGGMERVMSELANYFSTVPSTEVYMVLYGKDPTIYYDLSDNITVQLPNKGYSKSNRLFLTIKRFFYLRRTIKKTKPDSILSFGTLWNRFVLISLFGLKYPVYISNRSNPNIKRSSFQEFLEKCFYPSAAGIIAQTDYAKTVYHSKKLNNNIQVIANPIRQIEQYALEKENAILYVGRLIKSKNLDRLIRIFSKLYHPDWKLIIVGGDAQKQDILSGLKELVKELGVSDSVHFEGEKHNVNDYYLKSRIFAFTSSSEGFPNVVGEALSAGLPVVSYDCIAGPSDMITNGENGFLVPTYNDSQFQERLQFLINNEKRREILSKNAKLSMSKFSINTIGDKFLSFMSN